MRQTRGGIVPRLTDAQCKRAQPGEKGQKLWDEGGLFLFVSPKGHRGWRLKYRFADKEKLLTLGSYPDMTLAQARAARDRARVEVRDHRDPGAEKRKRRIAAYAAAGHDFETVARRWHEQQLGRWSPVHATKTLQLFERDLFPAIGKLALTDVDRPMAIALLRKIERRGAIDTAKRARQHGSAVFNFAEGEGLCSHDPFAKGVVKALLPTPFGGSQPGLSDVAEIRGLHAAVDASTSGPLAKIASRLLALTFVRPGLVPTAVWREFEGIDWSDPSGAGDAAEPIWRISADRMKLELDDKGEDAFEHVAPLTAPAVEALRALHRLTGRFPYPFHSIRSTHEPMSKNTLGYMYNRAGYKGRHVPHGWRTSFSTIMNERAQVAGTLEGDRPIIDAMLSHRPRGISAAEFAYMRAKFMPRRWELARAWAELTMDGLAPAATLVAGHRRAG